MSANVDPSKLFKPVVFSLTHLALVQVTLPLFNTFGADLIGEANKGIEREKSLESNESSPENCDENYKRAKEILQKMPKRLRWKVYDTSASLRWEVKDWKIRHRGFRDVECVFHWKYYGSIDGIKTAEQFVLKGNNNIRKRFEMACMYCLKESILTLWAEMEVSGDVEHFNEADESIVGFWVRWIQDGSRVPWTQAFLELNSKEAFRSLQSYSSFFPLLQPGERRQFLHPVFLHTVWDDFWLCLHSLSKDEEELLLQRYPESVFSLYLDWPLRSLLLEIVEKVIKYIDVKFFKSLVVFMLDNMKNSRYSDDVELFQGLWDLSSDKLKDVVKASPDLYLDIQHHFFSETRKRKADVDELMNSERKIMKKE